MKIAYSETTKLSLTYKLKRINYGLIILVTACCSIGFAMLYSAAGGDIEPWAQRHLVRYFVGLVGIIILGLINIRLFFKGAYIFYGVSLMLLVFVELAGEVGMGAQRWIDFGVIRLQPSELMKISVVIVLARYFHIRSFHEIGNPLHLVIPAFLILVPVVLVIKQPDLGTAIMIALSGLVIFFIAGVRIWKFILLFLGGIALVPIIWQFLLEYQKKRILTFLSPEIDPLGAGYHLMQSKIALGSGGLYGKGFIQGSQSHLNFLPEIQTDFIFTMLAEEFGLLGGLVVLLLFFLISCYGLILSFFMASKFARFLTIGMTTTLFFYVFINIGMVMGLLPIVGVPLPFISYGGSALLTSMTAIGLIISCHVHRDVIIGRFSDEET
ncbi:MAG: rod shape-determining protein RodA [Rhodospirillaceae bacterium]|nr:MAG: rod shape-determining protein RodA [Rhodospirillaceae bacterium]